MRLVVLAAYQNCFRQVSCCLTANSDNPIYYAYNFWINYISCII